MAGASRSDSELYNFSLTFRNLWTEQEFLRHALHGLASWLCWMSTCLLILYGIVVAIVYVYPSRWDIYPNSRMHLKSVHVGMMALMGFNVILSRCRRIAERAGFAAVELYIVANAIVVLSSILATTPQYMVWVSLEDGGSREDTGMLLSFAGVTACLHMNPFTRWHMMLPVQLFCVVAYAAPALLLTEGSVTTKVLYTVQLAGLVAAASMGKRMIQLRERQAFLKLLAEKTSRVASEFQLSQARSRSSSRRPSAESVPTTTDTDRAFNVMGEMGEQLNELQEIGRKEQWLLDENLLSWNSGDILGVGGFGIVVKGQYQGAPVAVKITKACPQTTASKAHLLNLCNEMQVLRRLRHPYIVGFYGAWLAERLQDMALVLELVDGVSLRSFINGSPDSADRGVLLLQVSCALRHLHSQSPRVVHGDMKCSNIFVESRNGQHRAKLLDFGLARRITKNARPMGGTLNWVAPEVMRDGRGPDTASDIFSFGCVVYFVVTGNLPREGKSRASLLMDLRTDTLPPLAWPEDNPLANEYRDLADRCNHRSAALRPHAVEVHQAIAALVEKPSGPPAAGGAAGSDLRAVRKAASEWRSKVENPLGQSLAAAFRHPGMSGRHPQLPLEGSPEEGITRSSADTAITRMYPQFDLTPLSTQTDMLAPTVVRCNIAIDVTACCQFHAAIQNLRSLVNLLGNQGCQAIVSKALGQCSVCGTIMTEDDASETAHQEVIDCDVCGGAVARR